VTALESWGILGDVTGSETVIHAGSTGASERRWRATRRAADLTWVIALLIAVPLSPVARYYLLSWPGALEWCLVIVIAVGVVGHAIAERRLRAFPGAAARDAEPDSQDAATPPRSRASTVVGWVVVLLLLPVAWACLVHPLIAVSTDGWVPLTASGVFESVLLATFLICPFLVGLLVWWLARGVSSTPERLIVAIVVACAAGLLAYGSLGYLPSMFSGLL